MKIYVNVKSIGKRKPALSAIPYDLPASPRNLRQLFSAIVESEVTAYNQKQTIPQLVPYLTAAQIEDQALCGKVSFGNIYSDNSADKSAALKNVLQCWEDGLIRVFMNETELTALDDDLIIKENTLFTFIRLTFLAGRMW